MKKLHCTNPIKIDNKNFKCFPIENMNGKTVFTTKKDHIIIKDNNDYYYTVKTELDFLNNALNNSKVDTDSNNSEKINTSDDNDEGMTFFKVIHIENNIETINFSEENNIVIITITGDLSVDNLDIF